ncbi:antitoxin [Salinibacterium sp. ZJ70]|uniref:antitoxin n=1 Tax=Salinibacterium sp. ZJ70 TaxID=2708084 RepID=UPI0014238BAE|nr:antitoxin [Salinibacterium sp. ZJ70]
MGLDDLAKQASGLFEQNKDTIAAALKSEQAEGISDTALDAAADFANKLTGGKFAEQVDGVRDAADKAVGTE